MNAKLDLIGKRFGKLVVISPTSGRKRREVMWLCNCDCGKQAVVQRQQLLRGMTKSCGCLLAEYNQGKGAKLLRTLAEKRKLPLGTSNMRALLYRYKREAKKRGLRFSLTEDQFKEITQHDCFYCGKEPSQIIKADIIYHGQRHIRHGAYVYNGIDRMNNSGDYSLDNCVACCSECNFAKGSKSIGKFFELVRRIANHRILPNGFRKGGNVHLVRKE